MAIINDNLLVEGSQSYKVLALSDFATGGSIGSAATTVDIYSTISVNQTTAAQTLSIPSPTASTRTSVVYLSNVGSVSFLVGTVTIETGATVPFYWNGATWSALSVSNTLTTQAIAAAGAITAWSSIVEATAAADYTLTLPTINAASTGKFIYLKKVDSGVGVVTVALTAETVKLNLQNDAVIIGNDGTNSYVFAEIKATSTFTVITSATTLSGNAQSITATNAGASYAITLPAAGAANTGNVVSITKVDANTNPITVAGAQIGYTLNAQGESVLLRSNGTVWVTLASSPSTITGTISAWAATTTYAAGEVVTNAGTIYRRVAAGTSGATFDAAEAANWTVIANYTEVSAWAASTYYPAGKIVTRGNFTLRRTADGTSGATFDNTEAATWSLVSQIGVESWSPTTYFYQNTILSQSNARQLVRATAGGVSAATFTALEAANWNLIKPIDLGAWVATSYYYQNEQVVTPQDIVVARSTAGTSGAAFDLTEAANWTFISQKFVNPFSGSTLYFDGQLAILNGKLYKNSTTRVSAATLTDVEFANWTLIADASVAQVAAKTADYTLLDSDDTVTVDTTAGVTTITMPTTPTTGKIYRIAFIAGANDLVINGNGVNVQNFTTGAFGATATYSSGTYLNATFTYIYYGTQWSLS